MGKSSTSARAGRDDDERAGMVDDLGAPGAALAMAGAGLGAIDLAAIRAALESDPDLKSANTWRGYYSDLAAFEAWRAGRPLGKLLVEAYAAELQHAGRSPHTVNRVLAAIRWLARRVVDLAHEAPGLSPAQRAALIEGGERAADVRDVKGTRPQRGRHIPDGEALALAQACARDTSPAGVRDGAIIALAYATGARRAEIAALELGDVDLDGEAPGVTIRHGKGDKWRRVPLEDSGTLQALRDWLALRGPQPGRVFLAVDKAGRVVDKPRPYGRKGKGQAVASPPGLSDEAMAQMLARRATEAGIVKPSTKPGALPGDTEPAITWHDFRRTFAGNLFDAGVDGVSIQKLMGHANLSTTGAYDRRDEHARRAAVRALHWPYTRRGQGNGTNGHAAR